MNHTVELTQEELKKSFITIISSQQNFKGNRLIPFDEMVNSMRILALTKGSKEPEELVKLVISFNLNTENPYNENKTSST